MPLHCAGPATQSAEQFQVFVGKSFLIHSTAQQNKLNMWYRKQTMQIQTEHQMNWFGQM